MAQLRPTSVIWHSTTTYLCTALDTSYCTLHYVYCKLNGAVYRVHCTPSTVHVCHMGSFYLDNLARTPSPTLLLPQIRENPPLVTVPNVVSTISSDPNVVFTISC